MYLFSPLMGQNAKTGQKLAKLWQTIDLPGVSEFDRESEESLQGARLTGMGILEFKDINGPAPKGEIWTN